MTDIEALVGSDFYRFRVAMEEKGGADTSDAQAIVDAEMEIAPELFIARSAIFNAMEVERTHNRDLVVKLRTFGAGTASSTDLARSTGRLQGLEQALRILELQTEASGR